MPPPEKQHSQNTAFMAKSKERLISIKGKSSSSPESGTLVPVLRAVFLAGGGGKVWSEKIRRDFSEKRMSGILQMSANVCDHTSSLKVMF